MGSGHYNTAALHAKVAEIQMKIPTGAGITLWQEMWKEGLHIEGFCVAAGIPTTEKTVQTIYGLKAVVIKHVVFKPGYADGITSP